MRIAALIRDIYARAPAEVATALDELTAAAAHDVPGAQYAGITATDRRGRIDTLSATGRYPGLLDVIQKRHQQGPCLEAVRGDHIVRVDDLSNDTRWPHYRRDALAETPIRSVLSFAMSADQHPLGALSLYSEQPHAFEAESEDLGFVWATHAALAWSAVRRDMQFRSARPPVTSSARPRACSWSATESTRTARSTGSGSCRRSSTSRSPKSRADSSRSTTPEERDHTRRRTRIIAPLHGLHHRSEARKCAHRRWLYPARVSAVRGSSGRTAPTRGCRMRAQSASKLYAGPGTSGSTTASRSNWSGLTSRNEPVPQSVPSESGRSSVRSRPGHRSVSAG